MSYLSFESFMSDGKCCGGGIPNVAVFGLYSPATDIE